ncbi:MAG: hypothetical protein IPI81_12955 [Flavobacteriales bacterium]|nr:hypothetical protein [Flavobacteriales bacterium]MCC6938007.1 hypothetical protein [Flavobacteriales bacterium]
MEQPVTTTIDHCTFTFLAPRLLEQRFHSTARFNISTLRDVTKVRDKLCGKEPCAVMVVIPFEVPVDPSATNVDHFTGQRNKRLIHALAIVAEGAQMHSVSKFYFNWYPQIFPVCVFDATPEALKWLKASLTERVTEV